MADSDQHTFQMAFNNTLGREGGFVDDKDDPGGATKYGVSLRYLRKQTGFNGDLDHDGDIDASDIFLLDLKDAKDIYYRDFWLKNKYDQITDTLVAMKTFDLCVNMGQKSANILLQRAINDTIGRITCEEDGAIGPQTLTLLNHLDPRMVIMNLRLDAVEHYEHLVEMNPAFRKYLDGWKIRANA